MTFGTDFTGSRQKNNYQRFRFTEVKSVLWFYYFDFQVITYLKHYLL